MKATIDFENGADVGIMFNFDIDMVELTDAELNSLADFLLALATVQANFSTTPAHVEGIFVPQSARSVPIT